MFVYDNNSITKDEETQFRSITVSLALSNDLDYNVKVVSFINELLFNSIALEERVPIREKFIKVDLTRRNKYLVYICMGYFHCLDPRLTTNKQQHHHHHLCSAGRVLEDL